ncbi:hypothetical protein [Shimazuella kribbensis]|uniref:hypothetical protein n=1 Tax=Shimazuella kribbensis TaxID=139808 RepID=UPI0012EB50E3|nr:hypothetical protein [Shimazuella kribbensis]
MNPMIIGALLFIAGAILAFKSFKPAFKAGAKTGAEMGRTMSNMIGGKHEQPTVPRTKKGLKWIILFVFGIIVNGVGAITFILGLIKAVFS